MEELHVIASGNVQGIGFRATAVSVAHRIGLLGFVRNLSDGSVEMVAQGGKKELEAFIAKMKDVFDADLACEFRSVSGEFKDFSIRF